MLVGIECMDSGVKRKKCVGNGDLDAVNVDMGIEAVGTDGASQEATRPVKSRGQGQGPREWGSGEEEPGEVGTAKPEFFAQHSVSSCLAHILTVPHCPSHWPPFSQSLSLIPFLLGGHLIC